MNLNTSFNASMIQGSELLGVVEQNSGRQIRSTTRGSLNVNGMKVNSGLMSPNPLLNFTFSPTQPKKLGVGTTRGKN